MKSLTLKELYEYYIDTLNKCGSFLLNENDEYIEYNIFEEFDIGIVSFFHEESLEKLFEGGFININQMKYSLELRRLVFELQNNNLWNIKALRTSEEWRKVLSICDKLQAGNL